MGACCSCDRAQVGAYSTAESGDNPPGSGYAELRLAHLAGTRKDARDFTFARWPAARAGQRPDLIRVQSRKRMAVTVWRNDRTPWI
jgi:hypothetical protein